MSGAKVYSTSFFLGCRSDYIFDYFTEGVDEAVDFVVFFPA